jgi:DNA mismatch repair protein MutS
MNSAAKPFIPDLNYGHRRSRMPSRRPIDRGDSWAFTSILFERPEDRSGDDAIAAPAFFADLNCDQIVNAITAGRDEYNLTPFFHACLRRIGAIKYRHEVLRDLENAALYQHIDSFTKTMREIRAHLTRVQKLHYREQQQAWFLDAVGVYCEAINSLAEGLYNSVMNSRGFLGFREYLTSYAGSVRFDTLRSEAKRLKVDLAAIEYCVQVGGSGFTVRKYEGESDYSEEVLATFEKFKQGAVTDYTVKFKASDDMNHIEAKILEFVAKLHPEVFVPLNDFCTNNGNFVDRTMAVFDREVQFYVAYLEYAAVLQRAGLQFCYPSICDNIEEIHDYGGFDIALAHKLVNENSPVVSNDFYLRGKERILVVSGPNQGGKTTFARAFGQLHYLASIGCPVPGKEAQLLLFDQIFTHFEKEEKVENLRGKLEDDLVRVHEILGRATPRSIIILNEVFTSTTIQDETFLSEKVMEKIIELGSLCVWVTFVDELASLGPQTVSMVSTVVPDNPALRTFRVVRRAADGLAYALAIAQKYRLTYDAIKERIKS